MRSWNFNFPPKPSSIWKKKKKIIPSSTPGCIWDNSLHKITKFFLEISSFFPLLSRCTIRLISQHFPVWSILGEDDIYISHELKCFTNINFGICVVFGSKCVRPHVEFKVQFSSVAQFCLTLCDSMGCSTPGLPDHHQLPEFTQTHVHRVSDAVQPSHPLSSPSSPAFTLSQHQGLFK